MAIDHPIVGPMELIGAAGPGGAGPRLLFCENDTNLARLYGATPLTPYPNNVFEGGFLGLDNIGPIDRSHLPAGYLLEQSDATGWMGAYALAMGSIAAVLDLVGPAPGRGSRPRTHSCPRRPPCSPTTRS